MQLAMLFNARYQNMKQSLTANPFMQTTSSAFRASVSFDGKAFVISPGSWLHFTGSVSIWVLEWELFSVEDLTHVLSARLDPEYTLLHLRE